MEKTTKVAKMVVYISLMLSFLILLGSFLGDVVKATDKPGNCICAQYRYPIVGCVGPTTRLCEGPPECADACG